MTADHKLILAVDFEPIIYPGDHLESMRGMSWPLDLPPQPRAFEYLEASQEFFEIHIISWRAPNYSFLMWWKRFGWRPDGNGKPEGLRMRSEVSKDTHVYLGTRVFPWQGVFPSPLELTKFVPYPQSEERK